MLQKRKRSARYINPSAAVTGLAAGRIVLGTAAWAAPAATARLFGVRAKDNPEALLMGRLFAVRDAALGIGGLQTSGDARKLMLALGVGCDVMDAAAAVLALRSERIPTSAALLMAGVALGAAGVGARALVSGR